MAETPVTDRPLPDEAVLRERLTSALGEPCEIEILERRTKQSGTFPKEIVRCRLHDQREVSLFCKYTAPRSHAFGHRRGIAYEAEVYRKLLAASPMTVPTYLGSFGDEHTGEAWLVLENLEGGSRASSRWKELDIAASWLGEFHRLNEGAEDQPDKSFLIRYDRPYYEGWAARTSDFSSHFHAERPWLPQLCRTFCELAEMMIQSPLTLVHGEYTIHNVMLMGDHAYPTDWESAAIGFGEIDLVCLLDNWTDEIIEQCTTAYSHARWPDGGPEDLDLRLLTAEVYLHLRWLGEDPEAMRDPQHVERRLDRLGTIARQLDVRSGFG